MAVFFSVLLLALGSAHAQVYKCPTADGSLSLQQVPCHGGQQLDVRPISTTDAVPTSGEYGLALAHDRRMRLEAATAQRRLFVGMSEADAYQAWGAPRRVSETLTADGWQRQWTYVRPGFGTQTVYTDGRVVTGVRTRER